MDVITDGTAWHWRRMLVMEMPVTFSHSEFVLLEASMDPWLLLLLGYHGLPGEMEGGRR